MPFINNKGGVGKSVLARAYAVEAARGGASVLIADLDDVQRTSKRWADHRKANGLQRARTLPDTGETIRIYRADAAKGNAVAQVALGYLYENAQSGLSKDDGQAAQLYRLAANQGNAVAQFNLGLFYAQGRGGLPKDEREAARLYKLAADQGNASAQANLGSYYAEGTAGPSGNFGPRGPVGDPGTRGRLIAAVG